MKTTLKWILGIVLVLAVAAGLFYAGTLAANSGVVTSTGWNMWSHPMMGGRGFERDFGPMMDGRGFGLSMAFWPLMLFGGLLRLALPLGLLALVGYFIYQQGKKAGLKTTSTTPPTTPPAG